MRLFLFVAFAILLFSGCDDKKQQLVGKWQGVEVLENDMPLEVDPGEIQFEFSPGGYYEFNSTINYQEQGAYSLDGDLLYTMDTLNEASSEKAVRISMLSKDSLFLQMDAEGKKKVIKLKRVN